MIYSAKMDNKLDNLDLLAAYSNETLIIKNDPPKTEEKERWVRSWLYLL
jgi:hypothetical protein